MSNHAAFALLAVACVTAAGGGAYLATRQNGSVPAPVQAISTETPSATTSSKPVQETEAIVGEPARPPQASIAIAPGAAPVRKREAAREVPARPAPRPTPAAESSTARNSSQL